MTSFLDQKGRDSDERRDWRGRSWGFHAKKPHLNETPTRPISVHGYGLIRSPCVRGAPRYDPGVERRGLRARSEIAPPIWSPNSSGHPSGPGISELSSISGIHEPPNRGQVILMRRLHHGIVPSGSSKAPQQPTCVHGGSRPVCSVFSKCRS